ncbi:MAG TPA: hypothetical protein PK695_07960 [Chitinophagaceae bacterium]|nr:hypothetical protein [Chitinophagaceae bacterium]HNA18311.1 hypothetical protein [Chitinophagaceae bacterium]HNA92113.1 hypothetical protein [Chitinophagaceae bacterium]HND94282.1 hypothetical protein [Chitinophagaceae bacterium]HNF37058.1 hypothetical protein [Chitinophagaceae bacterium]
MRKINLIFGLFFFSFLNFKCLSFKKKYLTSKNNTYAIQVIRQFPVLDNSGEVIKYLPLITKIYSLKNEKAIISSYYYRFVNQNDSIISDLSLKYKAFVYEQGNKLGVSYDTVKKEIRRNLNVDSVLLKEWVFKTDFFQFFNEYDTKLIFSLKNDSINGIIKNYTFVKKNDKGITGNIYLYYTKSGFEKVDYSFSPTLDSIKGMKLFKINIINNPSFYIEQNRRFGRISLTYFMETKSENSASKELDIIKENAVKK